MYPVTAETHPELISAVFSNQVIVSHMQRMRDLHSPSDISVSDFISSFQQYHRFCVAIQNQSSMPVSLSNLNVEHMGVRVPPVPNKAIPDTVYALDPQSGAWKVNPILYLQPFESTRRDYIIGFAFLPPQDLENRIMASATRLHLSPQTNEALVFTDGASEEFTVERTVDDHVWLGLMRNYAHTIKLETVDLSMRDGNDKKWHAKTVRLKANM
jgi:hypothetical protein